MRFKVQEELTQWHSMPHPTYLLPRFDNIFWRHSDWGKVRHREWQPERRHWVDLWRIGGWAGEEGGVGGIMWGGLRGVLRHILSLHLLTTYLYLLNPSIETIYWSPTRWYLYSLTRCKLSILYYFLPPTKPMREVLRYFLPVLAGPDNNADYWYSIFFCSGSASSPCSVISNRN